MREKKPTTEVKTSEEQLKDEIVELKKKISLLEADKKKLIDENKKLVDDNKVFAKDVPGLKSDLDQANDKLAKAVMDRDEAVKLLRNERAINDELRKQKAIPAGIVVDSSLEGSFEAILKDMQKRSNDVFKEGLKQLKDAQAEAQARAEATAEAEAKQAEAKEQSAIAAEIMKLAKKLK